MCNKDSTNFEKFMNPPPQVTSVYLHNITNPVEFFYDGGTAKIHEIGPFSFSTETFRVDAVIDEVNDTLSFIQYAKYDFLPDSSCSICQSVQNEVVVFNMGYNSLLARAKNEGLFMLAQTCSPNQTAAITNSQLSYCTKNEFMKSVNCRCCNVFTTCPLFLSSSSLAAGRVSWLASYDGGLQLSQTSTSPFPFSSGIYTPIARKASVSEILFGAPSPLLGFFSYNNRETYQQKNQISNTTNDLKDACYKLFCPNVEELVRNISKVSKLAGLRILSSVSCIGRVPSPTGLMNLLNITSTRARQLNYLEGVNCRKFTPAVVMAAYIANNSLSHSCHDPSDSPPCCIRSVPVNTGFGGSGYGCTMMFDGVVAKRRIFGTDDALKYTNGRTEFYTNCATPSKRVVQTMDRGQSLYKKWYTPSSFSYPKMPWADPTIINTGTAISVQDAYLYENENTTTVKLGENGHFISLGKVYPLKKNMFLQSNLNAQEAPPVEDAIRSVYVPYRYDVQDLQYIKKDSVNSIETFRYSEIIDIDDNKSAIEHRMRNGEVPYQNMKNLVYTSGGKPVMVSQPNFFGVEKTIWNQTDNSKRLSPAGNGVDLYRLYDNYESSGSANLLDVPALMTAETVVENSDVFNLFFDYTCNTGSALASSLSTMVSGYTLNCNPSLDKTCGLIHVPSSSNPTYCYTSSDKAYPCSAANVFTPKLHGEKVIPIFWLHIIGNVPNSYTDKYKIAIDSLYHLSIGIIVFAVLCFFSAVALILFIMMRLKKAPVV